MPANRRDPYRSQPRARRQPPRHDHTHRVMALLALLIGMLIVLSVALVIVAMARAGYAAGGNQGIFGKRAPAAPIGPYTPAPGEGWVKAATPPGMSAPQFAADDPLAGYGCVTSATPTGESHIQLERTVDGGKHWDSLDTGATGQRCLVSVDPANGHDVILAVSPLTTGPGRLWRSVDAGATWRLLALPAGAKHPTDFLLDGAPGALAWVGASVFALPANEPGHHLAMSANGLPLTWVNEKGFFASSNGTPSVTGLLGTKTTLYVGTIYGGGAAVCAGATKPTCPAYATTADFGATWTQLAPKTAHGQPVIMLTAQPRGDTLYGFYKDQADYPVRSADGGATWSQLLAFPGLLDADGNPVGVAQGGKAIFPTPDGAVFCVPDTASHDIFILPYEEHFWYDTAPPALNGQLVAVSWAPGGYASALWAINAQGQLQMFPLPTT